MLTCVALYNSGSHLILDLRVSALLLYMFRNAALKGVSHDVHADVKEADQTITDIHNNAEKFDPRTEEVGNFHNTHSLPVLTLQRMSLWRIGPTTVHCH